MDSESDLIVKTIFEICRESDSFKEYWFPAILTVITAAIGMLVAIFVFKYQKYIEEHKARMESFNELVLVLSNAFQGLVSVKSTYIKSINSNPLDRAGMIRDFLENIQEIKYDISKLSFLVSLKSDESYKYDQKHELLRISALICNYNKLVCLWHKRDDSKSHILKKLSENSLPISGSVEIDLDKLFVIINRVDFFRHLHLTEMVIKSTDDLIMEIFNLICTFKTTGEDCIDTLRIQRFGELIRYKPKSSTYEILKRTPEVDYKVLAKIFEEDEHSLSLEFKTGYESIEIFEDTSQVDDVNKSIEKEVRRQYLEKRHAKWW